MSRNNDVNITISINGDTHNLRAAREDVKIKNISFFLMKTLVQKSNLFAKNFLPPVKLLANYYSSNSNITKSFPVILSH